MRRPSIGVAVILTLRGEGVDLSVQGIRGQGRHGRREDRVHGRREEAVVLRHPAVGHLAGHANRRRNVVARRSPDLLELVVRRQPELPGRRARHHREERVGPGEPGVVVAEGREQVAHRRLQLLGRIGHRELGPVGLLVHRRDELRRGGEERSRHGPGPVALVVAQAQVGAPALVADEGAAEIEALVLEAGVDRLQRAAERHAARVGGRKARRKRQHAAAAAEERRPRALGQVARYFGIADVQGIEAFAAGLAEQPATVEAQVGAPQVGVVAVVAAMAHVAVEDQEPALVVESGVVAELLRRVADVADAGVDAARGPLRVGARRALPLRRVDLRRSARGCAQHAERGEQVKGAEDLHLASVPVMSRGDASARPSTHQLGSCRVIAAMHPRVAVGAAARDKKDGPAGACRPAATGSSVRPRDGRPAHGIAGTAAAVSW